MRLLNACLLLCLLAALASQLASAQEMDKFVSMTAATSKFQTFPGIPECSTAAVQHGDPSKGNATLLLKAKSGCVIPWHWHTPSESLMMVSGKAKVQMKDGTPLILTTGDFVYLPAKHVHHFTCVATCVMFDLTGDAPFDIHYVDASGNEIPADQALKPKGKPEGKKAQ